jgi:hypothetical protein
MEVELLKREEIICKTCELSTELHIVFIGGHTIRHDGLVECRLNDEPKQREETYWCAKGRWKRPIGAGYLISYEQYLNLLAEEEFDWDQEVTLEIEGENDE